MNKDLEKIGKIEKATLKKQPIPHTKHSNILKNVGMFCVKEKNKKI